MSKTCCGCCDCDCCVGTIDDNLDYLTPGTQILPQIHNPLATNTTLGIQEQLSNENNILISFGNITYGKTLNLNELTKQNMCVLNVKNISFTDTHSLMLIERYESNLIKETYVYGYGSNENGELGLDYDPKKLNNYYHSWTNIPLDHVGEPNTIFQKRLTFRVYNVYCGDKPHASGDGSEEIRSEFKIENSEFKIQRTKRYIELWNYGNIYNSIVLNSLLQQFNNQHFNILLLFHNSYCSNRKLFLNDAQDIDTGGVWLHIHYGL